MTLEEIKEAVDARKTVCWSNEGYEVRSWGVPRSYYIVCNLNESITGLTHMDGVTMNGREDQFFIKGR